MRDKVRGKIHILPNLVTASNLIMGVYAILLALFTLSSGDFSQKRMSQAAMYVFYGMIFDVFDGFVARLTKTSSHFGMELDSLADLVSFGVAPTVLTYVFILKDAPEPFRKIGVFCCMIYTCCAALRLARFNAQIEDEGKTFSGIPTPEAAGVIISYLLLVGHGYLNPEVSYFDRLLQHYVMPIAPMVLGLLMVATMRFPAPAKQIVWKRHAFVYLVLVVILLTALLRYPGIVLPVMFVGYLFYGLISWLVRFFLPKKPLEVSTEPEEH